MDIRYTHTNAKDFLTLMNYNTLAIFKAENNSSKLLFHFNLPSYKVVFGPSGA